MKFQMKWSLAFVLVFLTGLSACKKTEKGSKIPNITFKSLAPQTVKAGSSEGTVLIGFDLVDGDGDFVEGLSRVYVIDSRDATNFGDNLPVIDPPTLVDPSKPLKAFCTVGVRTSFLVIPADTMAMDSLQFEVYVTDDAGNQSNHFTTPTVYLTR